MKNFKKPVFAYVRAFPLRMRLARALDRNNLRFVYELSRRIDALQCALIPA